jgi:hypothetical protein
MKWTRFGIALAEGLAASPSAQTLSPEEHTRQMLD